MIVNPGTLRFKRSLNNRLALLFANGLVGAWYDTSTAYLFQDTAGTTPVTTAEDPVGRITDRTPNGNHAIQATAAARPTYRVDAGGLPYIAFLGTDDSLTCATGGGGSTGFFFCCAIKPTGGAGTGRSIFADNGGLTGYRVRISTADKLYFSAGDGASLIAGQVLSIDSVSVGTGYVLTAWDDGTNLNVQVNNGAVTSVARPTVSAGTAGFTVGKDNGAATSFLIADAYHMLYAKNTGLTAEQRRTEQLYAASKIGITL